MSWLAVRNRLNGSNINVWEYPWSANLSNESSRAFGEGWGTSIINVAWVFSRNGGSSNSVDGVVCWIEIRVGATGNASGVCVTTT